MSGPAHGTPLADEGRLLRDELDRLLAHRRDILARSAWRDVVLHSAGFSVAYVGDIPLRLGALLSLWSEGLFSWPCGCCGGPLYLTFIGGSPLSGSCAPSGFCEADRRGRRTCLPAGRQFGRDVVWPALRHIGRLPAPEPSGWSLAQVVASLGGRVDDVVVYDGYGARLARWDHQQRTLRYESGPTVPVPLDAPAGSARRRDAGAPARREIRIVEGDDPPRLLRVELSRALVLDDGRGRAVRVLPDRLELTSGDVVARASGALPPAVAAHLVRNIDFTVRP